MPLAPHVHQDERHFATNRTSPKLPLVATCRSS